MEKVWFNSYEKGIPHTINPEQYSSMISMFDEYCRQFSDKYALQNMGVSLSYEQLYLYSLQFAHYLQAKLKLKKGDRLAIMLPNVLQYPVVLFGALRLGLIVVNVNPLYTERELTYQLSNSEAAAIVILANFAHTLQKALPNTKVQHVIVTDLGDLFPNLKRKLVNFVLKYVKKAIPRFNIPGSITFREILTTQLTKPFEPVELNREDIAFLQFTGGTTGHLKGALLSHGNLVANVLQCTAWVNGVLLKGSETVVAALPLYHIFSMTICCLTFLHLGGLCLLITNPRDLKSLVKTLRKEKFSVFVGVNTLYQALNNNADFKKLDFSRLKLSLAGGMDVLKNVANEWQAITSKPIIMGYGLTEASPVVTINPLNITQFTGSIGLPIPSTDIEIRDDRNEPVKLGESGELWIKGPQVMKGYWKAEAETEHVFDEQGWMRTGDVVHCNEQGYLYINDRKKDMIIVSGFNVYPNEVEEVIAAMPEIAEVGVVGIPDQHSGEVVKAFIVRKDLQVTEQDVLQHCKKYLTGYKLPKYIEFRDALPKSNIGKILRQKLREGSDK